MTIDSSTRDKVFEEYKKGKTRDDIVKTLSQSGIKISTGSCSNIIKQSLQSKPESSNQDKVTTVLHEVEFKKNPNISIENHLITNTQDFEKNGYGHIEYELGQRGAPLNWFTNSSDYQSPSPSAVVQLQQEEELAPRDSIDRNLHQSPSISTQQQSPPKKIYPQEPKFIQERFDIERRAWDYYGFAWTMILEQITHEKYQRKHELRMIDYRKNKLEEWKKRLDATPYAVSVNPLTNTVYVANRGDNTLSLINGKTNTVTDTIKVGESPWAISVNPLTNMVYVANFYGDTVSAINGKTNDVTATIKVGTHPSAVSVNPSTNIAYVSNYYDKDVSVINGKTNKVTATITVGTSPSAVSVNPSTDVAYVANQDDNTVSVINGKTNKVRDSIQVGNNPNDLKVNPLTNTVYVANRGDNTVTVIDGKTNHVTTTVTVGKNPNAVSVNPSTDVTYVANRGDNTVSVIECKTNNVIDIK